MSERDKIMLTYFNIVISIRLRISTVDMGGELSKREGVLFH